MPNPLAKKVRELDIFSLQVFKLIFESGHANAVAKECGVSAPKVSRSLNALRIAFDDDLFYRRQQGLKPTPFAETLYPFICDFNNSFSQLEQLVQNDSFQDKDTVLRLAIAPVLMRSLAVKLAEKSVQNGLGKIQLSIWDDNSLEDIHKGELDFGLSFESTDYYELTHEKVADSQSVCIVAKDGHPIWQQDCEISLEDICQHPFLYLCSKGFNDKIDPLEQFCRENELPLANLSAVKSYEEWHAHLLTMNSISFAPAIELATANSAQGIRASALSQIQADRLHGSLKAPRAFFIERASIHRRYSNEVRDHLLTLFHQLFH